MDEYRVSGSNAYAPIPVRRPSRLPEEPKKTAAPVQKKQKIAPFSVLAVAVALLMLLCVLFSYVRMFETKSEMAALQAQKEALLVEQERLRAEYESQIDLDEIARRAAELGMHAPKSEQIQVVQIGEAQEQTVEEQRESLNVFEAFQSLFRDMRTYFD